MKSATAHDDVLSVLGMVAHDLRNPLSVISWNSGMLMQFAELPKEQQQKAFEVIHRAAVRMNRLIGDLLDVTRLQTGLLTIEFSDIDAREVVHEIEETLGHCATERDIVLSMTVPHDACCLRADSGRLAQALGNLVANALKFTADGGGVALSLAQNDLEVTFSVADTGPGIPAQQVARLFDARWQAQHDDPRGIGLGLSICREIVAAHGGRIWVESALGVGSSFSFALPKTTIARFHPAKPIAMREIPVNGRKLPHNSTHHFGKTVVKL